MPLAPASSNRTSGRGGPLALSEEDGFADGGAYATAPSQAATRTHVARDVFRRAPIVFGSSSPWHLEPMN